MSSMTITFSIQDLLLAILTASVLFGVIYFAVVMRNLSRLSQRAEELMSKLNRLADQTEKTLASADVLIREGTTVARDISGISARARGLAEEAVDNLAVILSPIRYLSALLLGIQRAFSAFRGGAGGETEKEEDDEKGNL
jgi:uncharacterized protein YoxC